MIGLLAIALWTSGWVMHAITTDVESIEVVLTDNMKDCVEKQGAYSLSLEENGEIEYEWCEISKRIYYSD